LAAAGDDAQQRHHDHAAADPEQAREQPAGDADGRQAEVETASRSRALGFASCSGRELAHPGR
jgi:hypothetical protein